MGFTDNAPVIPLGPGNSGALYFSVFKAPLKAWHCGPDLW